MELMIEKNAEWSEPMPDLKDVAKDTVSAKKVWLALLLGLCVRRIGQAVEGWRGWHLVACIGRLAT